MNFSHSQPMMSTYTKTLIQALVLPYTTRPPLHDARNTVMFRIHNVGRTTATKRTMVDQIVAIDASLAASAVVVKGVAVGVVSQPQAQPLLRVVVELVDPEDVVVGAAVVASVVVVSPVVVVVRRSGYAHVMNSVSKPFL